MSEPIDKTPRGVTNLRIKFRSANLDEFIERYAVDVSRGGIFIRTREPLSVGSRLKLDFQLLDAAPLLDGEGTVVWIRQPDPARAEVTPGMGVRFDKLSDDSQQRLDKILAEKERLGQSGKAPGMTKSGAGIAVRRPTGAFAPLDTSPAKAPPPVEVKAAPAGPAEAKPAPPPEPRRSGAFSTLGRPAAGFGRPRTTGALSSLRSAPAPSSLFEAPTSDDIDKALSVLEDKPGPIPALAPKVVSAAPIHVADDVSNEPTRVVSDPAEFGAHQTVTGAGASILSESGAPEAPVNIIDDRTARATTADEEDIEEEIDEATMAASPAAFAAAEKALSGNAGTPERKLGSLDAPLANHLATAKTMLATGAGAAAPPSVPPPPSAAGPGPLRKKSIVVEAPSPMPAGPMESGRFRTDATYRRPRKTAKRVALLVVLAAAGGAGYKFRARVAGLLPAKEVATAPTPPPAPEPKPALVADAGAASPDAALAVANPPPAGGEQNGAPSVGGGAGLAPKEEKPVAEPAKPAAEAKPAAAEEPRPKKKRRNQGASAAAGGAAAAAATAEGEKKPAEGDKKPVAESGEAAAGTAPAGGAVETPPAAAASPILKIVSTPSGAEVIIDGTSVGKTPLAIQGVDTSASHALLLKKDGYEPIERAVATGDWSQSKGGPTAKVTVKLRKASATESPKDEPKKDSKPDVEIITPDS